MNIPNIANDLLAIMAHVDDVQRLDVEFERVIWVGFREFLNELHLMRKFQKLWMSEKDSALSRKYLDAAAEHQNKVDEMLKNLVQQKKEFTK